MTRTKKSGIIVAYVKETVEEFGVIEDYWSVNIQILNQTIGTEYVTASYCNPDYRLMSINSIECNPALCMLEHNEPQMIENLWELLITSINHRLELDGELPQTD